MGKLTFNHGSFLLITGAKQASDPPIAGVLHPSEVNPEHMGQVHALLIDQSLDGTSKQALEALCQQAGKPFLWVTAPTLEGEENQDHSWLRAFIHGHHIVEPSHPSPRTIDRIKLKILIDIITTANSLLEPEEVMDLVMTQIHGLIASEAWSVLILENHDSQVLRFAAASGPASDQLAGVKVPFGEGIAGWVAKHRQPLIVNNVRNDPRFFDGIDKESNFETKNILCAPLVSRDRTLGVIEMLNRENQEGFTNDDLELVQILVNPAAVAIDNAFLFQRAQLLTIQDDLTDLYNSRHLNRCLDIEIERARRSQSAMSIIFLDLDGFKDVNDTFGHLKGSQTLVEVAHLIRGAARQTDIVGRYGGDEFMLILPDTDKEGAVATGERIRKAIAAFQLKGLTMTASIGIAVYPQNGTTKAALIREADAAMYAVKDRGKNAIKVAGSEDLEP